MSTMSPLQSEPDERPQKIWRYTDFRNVRTLMEKESLFFPRVDMFPDDNEGCWSTPEIEYFLERGAQKYTANVNDILATLENIRNEERRQLAASCWYIGEWESAVMWAAYGKGRESVAIQSTIADLIAAFTKEHIHPVVVEKVRYIDYDNERMYLEDKHRRLAPFFFKQREYDGEHELRAITCQMVENPDRKMEDTNQGFSFRPELAVGEADYYPSALIDGSGIRIKVDVEQLVGRIWLSPGASEEFIKEVLYCCWSFSPTMAGRVWRSRLAEQSRGSS